MSLENVTTKGIIYMIAGEPIDEDSGRFGCAHIRAARTIMEIEYKIPARGPVALQMSYFIAVDGARGHPARASRYLVVWLCRKDSISTRTISLSLSLGTEPTRRTRMVRFLVVDMPSAYNLILGRLALNTFQAVVSTYHMKLKFPVRDKPTEELLSVQLVHGEPDKMTKIGSQLSPALAKQLTAFLHQKVDVLAWSASDLVEPTEDQHLTDLAEMFDNLIRYHMKLNLAKCAFGVRNGRFLGYVVMEKGIEVNPNKI
ncbi:hypothetical protein Sango_1241900 [Sesamum angolense]|uniref:Reverse transcriptase domain-containing protein n=1 Tax=Sesamum angolense TaxID=2727404 RepID=A0AAE1WQY5_9LAMI|nr:hypothetical protein Sango_1241900 [Sesamum angolense]